MAVTYKSHKSGAVLLIGGQSTASSGGGLVGPFPRYSIGRTDNATGDGTYFGSKYTIEITGTAVIKSSDSQDILEKGRRQSRIQGEAITALQFDRSQFPTQGSGKLEIAPYGGLANVIVFDDARIVSISLPEQTEESAGTQTLEYNFTFEAFIESSSNTNAGKVANPVKPTYNLSSASEDWDLQLNDAKFFKSHQPDGTLHKTYTLTHKLSATGIKKYASGALATEGEAWRQAQRWVQSKLQNRTKIKDNVTTDMFDDSTFWITGFIPINMDGGTNLSIAPNFSSGESYVGYNHTRVVNTNAGDGVYEVTETWILSSQEVKATHSIELTIEDDKAGAIKVDVSAVFTGLNSKDYDDKTLDLYDNAKLAFDSMKDKFFTLASAAYTAYGGPNSLIDVKLSESLGQNRVDGTITYRVSYNDDKPEVLGALTEQINLEYSNDEALAKIIAKIPIIGKLDGPVIQDMTTTPVKTLNASMTVAMDRNNRTDPPTSKVTAALDKYKPPGDKTYMTSKTETWNPKTGAYTLNVTWEYI